MTNTKEQIMLTALAFYGPMVPGYTLYDTASDRDAVRKDVLRHIESFKIYQPE